MTLPVIFTAKGFGAGFLGAAVRAAVTFEMFSVDCGVSVSSEWVKS